MAYSALSASDQAAVSSRLTIACYITPHGFGHAVRCLEVIRRLLELDPTIDITVVSDLPEFLIRENAGKQLFQRRRRLDIGLVQRDSLQFDLRATLGALVALRADEEKLLDQEVRFLTDYGIQAVISDVAFLPFKAAFRCGIPAIGMGNFTWDWIYKWYARNDSAWEPLVQWIRDCYEHCNVFLQLPMHGDCSVFRNIVEVPLVARKARRNPQETRRILDYDPTHSAYLVSFVAFNLDERAQQRLERMEKTTFFYKRPIMLSARNARSLDAFTQLSYADVVAAVDGVITKPGYGIVSDCLANHTSMVYADRGDFPEYPILVEWIEKSLISVYLPSADLYTGRWEHALRRMESLPRTSNDVATDGADVCARYIIEYLGRRSE